MLLPLGPIQQPPMLERVAIWAEILQIFETIILCILVFVMRMENFWIFSVSTIRAFLFPAGINQNFSNPWISASIFMPAPSGAILKSSSVHLVGSAFLVANNAVNGNGLFFKKHHFTMVRATLCGSASRTVPLERRPALLANMRRNIANLLGNNAVFHIPNTAASTRAET